MPGTEKPWTRPIAETEPPVETALHALLPAGFPAIHALSVEDHYVRVHGAGQSEMLLMNLGDAIAKLPGEQGERGHGERVHRGWWAARGAVRGHRRKGREVELVLTGDLVVPVSRPNVAKLRAAGWLDRAL